MGTVSVVEDECVLKMLDYDGYIRQDKRETG